MKSEKIITIAFMTLVSVHVALCVYAGFQPLSASRGLVAFYKIYALPGPFFKDNLIRSVPHFVFSSKTGQNRWSPWRDAEAENFADYHQNHFHYAKLKQSVFERALARNLALKVAEGNGRYPESVEFRELQQYLAGQYLPSDTDSVSCIYFMTRLKPGGTAILADTLFSIKYKVF